MHQGKAKEQRNNLRSGSAKKSRHIHYSNNSKTILPKVSLTSLRRSCKCRFCSFRITTLHCRALHWRINFNGYDYGLPAHHMAIITDMLYRMGSTGIAYAICQVAVCGTNTGCAVCLGSPHFSSFSHTLTLSHTLTQRLLLSPGVG